MSTLENRFFTNKYTMYTISRGVQMYGGIVQGNAEDGKLFSPINIVILVFKKDVVSQPAPVVSQPAPEQHLPPSPT